MISEECTIHLGPIALQANLAIPTGAKGIVLFAHGSGSSRHSPRNQFMARQLNHASIATLLIDLLTTEEEAVDEVTQELRFDIPLLSNRLVGITDWLSQEPRTKLLAVGYFGASTGAAAKKGTSISAVVSRGGRPDLAASYLPKVQSPTLFIVGGLDEIVIELNQTAYSQLTCKKQMEIVPGATHLFEEPGCLEEVSRLTCAWFSRYFSARPST